jgi:hypothetical protein
VEASSILLAAAVLCAAEDLQPRLIRLDAASVVPQNSRGPDTYGGGLAQGATALGHE